MGRSLWEVEIFKKLWPTRYASAKAAAIEPVGRWMKKALFEGDQMTQIPINQTIEGVEQGVSLPVSILEEFVRAASVRVVMHHCICRDSNHCKDFPVHTGCVFLGEAARGINPKLGKQVGVEEALGHIKDAVKIGLVPFVGRNKLDTVWLGIGPGDRLFTICLCCPCCCLYSVVPYLPPNLRKSVVRFEGLEIKVTDGCVGCGRCETVCVSKAIHVEGERAAIRDEACVGCGRCATECPQEAIEVRITRHDAIEACKARLRSRVDLS